MGKSPAKLGQLCGLSGLAFFFQLHIHHWFSSILPGFAALNTLAIAVCLLGLALGFRRSKDTAFLYSPYAFLATAAVVWLMQKVPSTAALFSTFSSTAATTQAVGGIALGIAAALAFLTAPFLFMLCIGSRLAVLFNETQPLPAYSIFIVGTILGSSAIAIASALQLSSPIILALAGITLVALIKIGTKCPVTPFLGTIAAALAVLCAVNSQSPQLGSPVYRLAVWEPTAKVQTAVPAPAVTGITLIDPLQQKLLPANENEKTLVWTLALCAVLASAGVAATNYQRERAQAQARQAEIEKHKPAVKPITAKGAKASSKATSTQAAAEPKTKPDPAMSALFVSIQLFLLGAAYALLDQGSASRLLPLFGGTWLSGFILVNLLLVLILAANRFISRVQRPKLQHVLYVGLFVSLPASFFLPWLVNLSEKHWPVTIALVVFFTLLPIFRSALIFATAYQAVPVAARAFALYLIGLAVGTLLQPAIACWGINSLIVASGLVYVGSLVCYFRATKWSGLALKRVA